MSAVLRVLSPGSHKEPNERTAGFMPNYIDCSNYGIVYRLNN